MAKRQVGRIFTASPGIAVGAVFLWAGAVKAWDPAAFLVIVQGYRLLPYQLEVATALYLPWLEIVCGVALVVGRLGRSGALAICSVLTIVFMVALIAGWERGLDITCGCFGANGGKARYGIWLARDLGLLAIIALVWFLDRRLRGVSGQTGGG